MKALLLPLCIGAASLLHAQSSRWNVIWSDEFNGPAKSAPDPARWTYDLGGGGWGNHELEVYTNRADNVFQDGEGHLIIRALKTDAGFTSARIKTQGKFDFQYGRIEARIRIPFGQGIWPAFWMLGSDIASVGWPDCGEIDVMENIGKEPATVHATVHGPGYSGGHAISGKSDSSSGQRFADDFHVFGMVWEPNSIQFFIDGSLYHRVTPADLPSGVKWVYDHSFFLLLNVAVGGSWPGNPDETSTFPQSMSVDWVRVSKLAEPGSRPRIPHHR
jgi:beta-glucanase (GH16 family)